MFCVYWVLQGGSGRPGRDRCMAVCVGEIGHLQANRTMARCADYINSAVLPLCETRSQYLLTCKVSRYCLLVLHGDTAKQPDPPPNRKRPQEGAQIGADRDVGPRACSFQFWMNRNFSSILVLHLALLATPLIKRLALTANGWLYPPVPHIFGFSFFISTLGTTF